MLSSVIQGAGISAASRSMAQTFANSALRANARRFYSPFVQEHFTSPRNVGGLDGKDPAVGTAVVGKAACGDVIKLQVKIDPTKGKIEDVKFKAFGCGAALASSSYATELIKGKSVEEALAIKNSDIADSLALPPVKIHCSLLAEDAIKLAIRDWQAKQAQAAALAAPNAG